MNRDCERFERLISDSLDGEISSTDEVELREHLSHCRECRGFQESAIECRERLRSLPDSASGALEWHSTASSDDKGRFWGKRVSLPVPVAAMFAALMLAGWLLALRPTGPSTTTSPPRPVLVRSVEIIRVEPAQAAPVGSGQNDSANQKEDEI